VRVWSIYSAVVGLGLLLIPDPFLGLTGIDVPADTVWIRVIGVTAIAISILHWFGAAEGARWYFRATVYERVVVAVLLAVLAFAAEPVNIVLFAAIDLGGAIWTQMSLNAEKSPAIG
jgi:hypothetical protein